MLLLAACGFGVERAMEVERLRSICFNRLQELIDVQRQRDVAVINKDNATDQVASLVRDYERACESLHGLHQVVEIELQACRTRLSSAKQQQATWQVSHTPSY